MCVSDDGVLSNSDLSHMNSSFIYIRDANKKDPPRHMTFSTKFIIPIQNTCAMKIIFKYI